MADDARADSVLDWLRAENAAGRKGRVIGQGYQAVIERYDTPFGAVVVKCARPSWVLGWLNRTAVRHEHRVYEGLAGIRGVPRSYGLLTPAALVLEYIEGRSLRQMEAANAMRDRDRFFADLRQTLTDMHAAGIAHGDLKRKDNILVAPDESPRVIDFGTAWRMRPGAGAWNRWIFAWFAQSDDNAWIKLKYRRRLEEISDDDRRYHRPLWLERLARWIRIPYQKITLRRLRKRWRAGRHVSQ